MTSHEAHRDDDFMLGMPTGDQHIRGVQQPLDPKILQFMEPHGFETALDPEEGHACDAWYDLLADQAEPQLRPEVVNASTERLFAHFVSDVVSKNVAYDALHQSNRVFDRVYGKGAVGRGIDLYYATYVQHRPGSVTRIRNEARRAHQDAMIERAVKSEGKFMEIGVMLGIQRAFVARRLRFPTRASYAILSSYGDRLRGSDKRERPQK